MWLSIAIGLILLAIGINIGFLISSKQVEDAVDILKKAKEIREDTERLHAEVAARMVRNAELLNEIVAVSDRMKGVTREWVS